MNLNDRSVLITGGSSGIGRATAAALQDKGARVTINGRDSDRLREAAEALGCHAVAGDVGDEAQAERVVRETIAHHGSLDVLVNNAGFGLFAPLVEFELADFEAVMRTNVTGCFLVGRAAARHMVERKSGAIVNVASTAALRGFQRGTAYATSKFALRGMTECWREELRRHDIRVMLVNPSEVLTDFARRSGRTQEHHDRKLQAEDIAEAITAILEMNDRGFVPELAVFATNPF